MIKDGLKEGDKIITSDLVPVIEGIKLELIESDEFQKEIAALAIGESNTNADKSAEQSTEQSTKQ